MYDASHVARADQRVYARGERTHCQTGHTRDTYLHVPSFLAADRPWASLQGNGRPSVTTTHASWTHKRTAKENTCTGCFLATIVRVYKDGNEPCGGMPGRKPGGGPPANMGGPPGGKPCGGMPGGNPGRTPARAHAETGRMMDPLPAKAEGPTPHRTQTDMPTSLVVSPDSHRPTPHTSERTWRRHASGAGRTPVCLRCSSDEACRRHHAGSRPANATNRAAES